jgi:hypothetical protein
MITWKAFIGCFGTLEFMDQITHVTQDHKPIIIFGLENAPNGGRGPIDPFSEDTLEIFRS